MSNTDLANGNTATAEILHGVLGYLSELQEDRAVCERHRSTAAVHLRGEELQVYRMFQRQEDTAASIRRVGDQLPGWDASLHWRGEGTKWNKLAQEVDTRMKKHREQHPVYTRGISWNHRPILIHAYKFEPDPVMKLELILPNVPRVFPELPLKTMADALRCQEYLVPSYVAEPLPPYDHHEAAFQTIPEYLSHTMPEGLYASRASHFTALADQSVPRMGVVPHR